MGRLFSLFFTPRGTLSRRPPRRFDAGHQSPLYSVWALVLFEFGRFGLSLSRIRSLKTESSDTIILSLLDLVCSPSLLFIPRSFIFSLRMILY